MTPIKMFYQEKKFGRFDPDGYYLASLDVKSLKRSALNVERIYAMKMLISLPNNRSKIRHSNI